ncbi:MAG: hypothetical protein JSS91_06095 [Bacteroidetes bacterium]|nr:hypothetical protein [Bacteroidota bacterium]
MESFKTETIIQSDHKIQLENLPFEIGEKVIVTVLQKSDIITNDIMKLEDQGGAFDFLKDEKEDIYTVNDLKVKYK